MAAKQEYYDDLNALPGAMTPGKIDMRQIEANERHHRHRFFDLPETVQKWLLDQQRRVQSRRPGAKRARSDGAGSPQRSDRSAGLDDVRAD